MDQNTKTDVLELARACARAAVDKKAENVIIYDLRDISSLTDYAVVCTGLSAPHLKALAKDIDDRVMELLHIHPVYKDTKAGSLWSVLDYIDVMVHVFGAEVREFYGVDELWGKAPTVSFDAE